jgi:type II secretory pathway component GspD/PulD (secretin)
MMGGMGGGMGGGGQMMQLVMNIMNIEKDSWDRNSGMMGMMRGGRGNRGGYGSSSMSQSSSTTTSTTGDVTSTGKGTISSFGMNTLMVNQSPEVHEKIEKLIKLLSGISDDQVSIETRFIVVSENFLEDIGLHVNVRRLQLGGKLGVISNIAQGSWGFTQPVSTGITSSIAEAGRYIPGNTGATGSGPALSTALSFGDSLDDLAVDFMLRMTNAHSNARTLTAPKITVISGEPGMISVTKVNNYIANVSFSSDTIAGGNGTAIEVAYIENEIEEIETGIEMDVTPTITADKKYVLLSINTTLSSVRFGEGLKGSVFGVMNNMLTEMTFDLPEEEESTIETRVRVPDQGTVLLGGLTLTAHVEKEMGVPILSKIPIINRFFSNRSEVEDREVLLILVKPTIILKDEVEANAVAQIEDY